MERREERQAGTARVIGLHDDDGSFDGAFWRAVPPEKRLEMVWDMVLEFAEWRGGLGAQQGLQKSLVVIERRR